MDKNINIIFRPLDNRPVRTERAAGIADFL